MAVLIAAVGSVPESGFVPVHAAEAVQLVALVTDHVSVVVEPLVGLTGFALNVITGSGGLVAAATRYVPAPAVASTRERKLITYVPVGAASDVERTLTEDEAEPFRAARDRRAELGELRREADVVDGEAVVALRRDRERARAEHGAHALRRSATAALRRWA